MNNTGTKKAPPCSSCAPPTLPPASTPSPARRLPRQPAPRRPLDLRENRNPPRPPAPGRRRDPRPRRHRQRRHGPYRPRRRHPPQHRHARLPRRRDLLHDILHTHIDTLHEILGGTDDALEDQTPEIRLEAAIAALLDGIKKHESAHKLAHAALSSLPPEVRDNQRHRYRLLVFRLGLVIERALPGLEDQRALFGPLARGLLATIAEAAFWFRDDGAFSRAEFARLLTSQTLAGGVAMLAAGAGAAARHAPSSAPR